MANRIKLSGTTVPSFQVGLQGATISSEAVTSSYTLTLPPQLGEDGQVLVTDEFGNLNWSTEVGPQGPQGIQGETGPQGEQGIQGETGATGATGAQGIQGETGPQGEQGIQGETGPQGVQGIHGVQGEQGIQGEVGAQGPLGIQGETGAQGPAGAQGEQGIQGEQGAAGVGINLKGTVATVGDLPATGNQDGDAYIVEEDGDLYDWTGTAWVSVGQIVGPQGATGAQGPQGIQGEAGAQGPAGPQGEQGIEGPQGPQGIEGPQGVQGIQGVQGATGATGAGLAAGGTAGQIISKVDSTDYNTQWIDAPVAVTSLPAANITGAGNVGQIMFADASGNLTSSARLYNSTTTGVNHSRDSAGPGYIATQYANTAAAQIVIAKAKGTKETPVAMAVNDTINGLVFLPYTGNGTISVDGTAGFANNGSFIQTVITELPTTSGNLAGLRMRLGTSSEALNTTQVVLDLNSDRSATFFGNVTMSADTNLKGFRETVLNPTFGSTIAPNAANGTIVRYTASTNFTFNGFTNPVAGQSMTVVITQGTGGSKLMTSTMKFIGGSKTLSTAAGSIDVISVFYDGVNYLASLSKGFV